MNEPSVQSDFTHHSHKKGSCSNHGQHEPKKLVLNVEPRQIHCSGDSRATVCCSRTLTGSHSYRCRGASTISPGLSPLTIWIDEDEVYPKLMGTQVARPSSSFQTPTRPRRREIKFSDRVIVRVVA